MMILVLIGIGIVLFSIGILFVIKGYMNTPNENTVVPLKDLEKVRVELVQTKESEARFKTQMEQQKTQLETTVGNLEAAKAKEESILRSLQEFQASVAGQEQIYKTNRQQLETEIATIKEKADTQAKEALEMVNSLSSENESLKNNLESLQDTLETVETKLHKLEAERDSAANLSANNELLKNELGTYRSRIQELEQQFNSLQKENQILRNQQDDSSKFETLQNTFQSIRQTLEQELGTNKLICATLKSENQTLNEKLQQSLLEKERNLIQLEALRQQLEAVKTDSSRHLSAAVDHVKSENIALRSQIKEQLERLQPVEAQLFRLQKEKEERTAGYDQTIADLKVKNQLLQSWLEENLTRVKQLENELSLTNRHEQEFGRESQDTIDHLTQERNMLLKTKADLESNLTKLKDLNTALSQKEEMMQYELTKIRAQAISFETEGKSLRLDLEARLKEINNIRTDHKTIRAERQLEQEAGLLKVRQLEGELLSVRKKSELEISEAHAAIENLQAQKDSLLAAKADLEKDSKKIKEFSANLLQKEDMLQYELTKARAQAMGLEKISEDFKVEIETSLKEINELKEQNHSLRQLQQETEENLNALKEVQTEYMKKEKIYQSELEKSRTQLLGMEKIYSDFRSQFESIEAVNPNRSANEKAKNT